MIVVEIGNNKAKEGYRDPTSDDPELVRYKKAPGERVTTFNIPDDSSLVEAFMAINQALKYHMMDGGKPAWVTSSSKALQQMLEEHYQLENSSRPEGWGEKKRGSSK